MTMVIQRKFVLFGKRSMICSCSIGKQNTQDLNLPEILVYITLKN